MNKNKGEANVECKRCGNQWYSRKFEEKKELPHNCPKCYQASVREIPAPPTKIDKFKGNSREKINSIPEKVSNFKKEIIDFREKNRMIIGIINTAIIISVVIAVLMYVIFVR